MPKDSWTVLYQLMPFVCDTLSFTCRASDTEDAEEQCVNTFPDAGIVWTFQGEAKDAYAEYWAPSTGFEEN
jgi:hypothetical protein